MTNLDDRTINEMMISQTTPFTTGNSFGTSFATSMTHFGDQVIATPNRDLLGLVSFSARTRADYLKSLGDIKEVDAARAIVDIYSEKTLYASKEDEIFTVNYTPERAAELEPGYVAEINENIQDFIERSGLYSFLKRNVEKLLLYGELPFRKEFSVGKGITAMVDDVSVSELVGVYSRGTVDRFYMVKQDSAQEVSKESYGHFILNPVTINELSGELQSSFKEGSTVMGKSILYGAIEQLKNLRTNQIVALIDDIKKVLRPQFYGVSVPDTANPDEVTKLLRKYERDFRSPADALGRDSANLTVNDIVYLAAQIRFVPQFANGKGAISQVEAFNHKGDYEENLAKRNAYLQQIAVLAALPPSYLSPTAGQQPGTKVEDMKLYSRFAKRLVMIQDAVEEGIKDLVLQDIYYRTGYRVKRRSISVKFNSTVDSELLDAIEFTVGNVDIGERFLAWTNNVTQAGLGIQPRAEVMLQIFNRLARALSNEDLFELTGKKPKAQPDTDSGQLGMEQVGLSLPPPPSIGQAPGGDVDLDSLESAANELGELN